MLISRINKDWFEACVGKRKGFVPANYVEIIKEPSLLSSPTKVVSPQGDFINSLFIVRMHQWALHIV